ncbi:NADH-dependent butanol dehydrogenase A [Ligilactobacillus salitolerans]|uniref:NADH-dependent butanol dehydrogenase A n=1 Tax=Ligilactobacillus salitolerans TaxID=1808352 RepID=A0A401IRR7_9LACO|nr:iron-containing alcohol dehydrogenase [Ligilactobacillus salitolerans]GBG94195.1 NADH-dependent butanol dehydrogenase A [Ligilactobacillus salitolerans]
MLDFTFHNQTDIRFGRGHIDNELYDVLHQYGTNVLLVYGGHSLKQTGLYDRVLGLLKDLNVTELPGIEPNPKISSIREGQKLAKDHQIDVILAVGGGSVIDAAKVIASAAYYKGDPWDLVISPAKRQDLAQLPVVDILTLAATGSEMNFGSVISDPTIPQKKGTQGPNSPAVSFLDPTLTYTVPTRQTAAGASDIFSHLCEQYFDTAENNDVSKSMIEGLMRTVIKWAPIAVKEPENYDARANLMWAATMALNGIVGLGTVNHWTVHPLEHELSAQYDITHGIGLAILTPRWMKFALNEESKPLFARFARAVWDQYGYDDMELAENSIRRTHDWLKSLNSEMTLPDVGITDDSKFADMAKAAVAGGSLDTNAYVPVTEQDAIQIYRDSMHDFAE